MKQKQTIFILFLFLSLPSIGCDFCGCFMGITPYDNQSSIAVIYRYKSYNGYHYSGQTHHLLPRTMYSGRPSATTDAAQNNGDLNLQKHGGNSVTPVEIPKTGRDYEIYSTAELRVKYFIHKRIELSGILPFAMNKSRINEEQEHVSGVGDINAFVAYHLINRIMTEKFQHRLIVGAGIKLPVGNYYAKNAENKRIDFMLQPGTGSIDYPVYINYIFGFKKLGLNFNSTFKFNGNNFYRERVSNSSTNYLNLFYKFREDKDLKIFPSIQAYYEYSKGVWIHDFYQDATQMEVLAGGIGLDLFYKNVGLNCSFQLPVYEKKFESNLAMAGRFMMGLTYSFNQKKYLFNKKT